MPNLISTEFGVKIAGIFADDDVVGGNIAIDDDALEQAIHAKMAELNFDDLDVRTAQITAAYTAADVNVAGTLEVDYQQADAQLLAAASADIAAVLEAALTADNDVKDQLRTEREDLVGRLEVVEQKADEHKSILKDSTEDKIEAHDIVAARLSTDLITGTGDAIVRVKNLFVEEGEVEDGLNGLVFAKGYCTESLNLMDDARIVLAPDERSAYRFGAKNGETDEDRDLYDGLHMYSGQILAGDGEPVPDEEQADLNEIKLTVNDSAPTVAIRFAKDSAQEPVIEILDRTHEPKLIFNAQGEFWTSCTTTDSQGPPPAEVNAISVNGKREVSEDESAVFSVLGNGQTACGNLECKGTVADQDLLTVRKHNNNRKFVVKENGAIQIWSTSSVPLAIENAVTGQTGPLLELLRTGQLRIHSNTDTGPAGGELLQIYNKQNVKVFGVNQQGQVYYNHDLDGVGQVAMGSSVVPSDSLYVGYQLSKLSIFLCFKGACFAF